MAGQSAWDLIQPKINGFIQSFSPENVPVSQGWKDAAKEQNTLRKKFQDYAPGAARQKPTAGSNSYASSGGNGLPSDYKETELAAGQKAEDFRKGAGFTGQTPTVSTRDVQKADGSKGTQTSPGGGMPVLTAADAAKFYQDRNIGGFMSNQLPGQQTNPFSGTTIEAVPFGGQEQSVTTNTLGAYSVNGQAYAALDPTKPGAAFNPQAPTIEGGSQRINQTPGVTPGNGKGSNRLNAALNDTAGIQSYMSKFGSPEQDRMRSANMAFLNTEGSMKGLRAKEAVLGQIYAGGETYQLNEDRTQLIQDKNNKPIAANKENTRAYKAGNMSAGDYRESFKGAVMQQNTQTPATSQNPTALNPVPVSQQPTNTNFGPMIDSEQTGRMLESLKGMKGVGAFIDGPTYGEFLEGNREPLMRDPRKK